jgi:exopolysaccharide biosynthesis WecB/TagA/CpsF family protein
MLQRPRAEDEVVVGGLPTTCMDQEEIADWMIARCQANIIGGRQDMPPVILSSNGQGIALLGSDPAYDAAMMAADMIHADGMSVVKASRLLTRRPIRGRSCTTDLFEDVTARAVTAGLGFYFLGATEDQNRRAVAAVEARYPALRISGRHHGFFGPEDDAALCAEILASGADVLWVALGKPKQEIWCHRNQARLRGLGCIKTCGGLYSYLALDVPRAPLAMRKAGFEWLYRFLKEPTRLGHRYLVTNTVSAWRMLRRSHG